MHKVIETMLTTTSARSASAAKKVAVSQTTFTPWEGGE